MSMSLVARLALLLLLAGPALAQEEKPGKTQAEEEKPKGEPVPRFEGTVRLAIFAEIVPTEEDVKEKKEQVSLEKLREVLHVESLEHEAGSHRIGVRLKGTYADAARLWEALKKEKITAEVVYPARVSLLPKIRISKRLRDPVLAAVREVKGVEAAGIGRGWGQPDPSVGILSVGSVLDARPIVSADRKYVMLTTTTTNSSLQAMLTISINPVIAFADLDKVSPIDLQKAVGLGSRSTSHRQYSFTFEEAGSEEEARKRLLSVRGYLRASFNMDAGKATVVGTSRLSRSRVKRALDRAGFEGLEEER